MHADELDHEYNVKDIENLQASRTAHSVVFIISACQDNFIFIELDSLTSYKTD